MDAAHGHPGHRQLGVRERLGDAEVGHLDPAAGAQQHVAGLDVPVHDAPRMRRVECVRDLLGDAGRDGRRQRTSLPEGARKVAAGHQLHHDVRPDRVLAVVEHRDHVGVVQLGCGLCLALEPGEEADVGAVLPAQHLDGHVATQLGVASAVDGGHATLADQLREVVAATQDVTHVSHARAPWSARRGGHQRRSTVAR